MICTTKISLWMLFPLVQFFHLFLHCLYLMFSYVPQLSISLLSISQLFDSGFDALFSSYDCAIQDRKSQKVIGIGAIGLITYAYWKACAFLWSPLPIASSFFFLDKNSNQFYLCHSRLGYLSSEHFECLIQSNALRIKCFLVTFLSAMIVDLENCFTFEQVILFLFHLFLSCGTTFPCY